MAKLSTESRTIDICRPGSLKELASSWGAWGCAVCAGQRWSPELEAEIFSITQ